MCKTQMEFALLALSWPSSSCLDISVVTQQMEDLVSPYHSDVLRSRADKISAWDGVLPLLLMQLPANVSDMTAQVHK